jgi:hypothetical protein
MFIRVGKVELPVGLKSENKKGSPQFDGEPCKFLSKRG